MLHKFAVQGKTTRLNAGGAIQEQRNYAGGSNKRVLVVDDSSDNADFLAKLILRCQHEVAVAHCGQEALEIAPHFRPRLIFMDISMPIMDGYETSRRLRDAGVGAPIVALTALDVDRARLGDA